MSSLEPSLPRVRRARLSARVAVAISLLTHVGLATFALQQVRTKASATVNAHAVAETSLEVEAPELVETSPDPGPLPAMTPDPVVHAVAAVLSVLMLRRPPR